MVLHELAVTAFRMGEPGKAGTLLEKVLELIRGDGAEAVEETESAHAQFLEPIFVNMGHTLRKRGIFEEVRKLVDPFRPAGAETGLSTCFSGRDVLFESSLSSARCRLDLHGPRLHLSMHGQPGWPGDRSSSSGNADKEISITVDALSHFCQALARKPDDKIAKELLNEVRRKQ